MPFFFIPRNIWAEGGCKCGVNGEGWCTIMAAWSESTAPSCHDHTFAVAIQPLGPHHHDGEGLFVKLAGFFRCGLNFGKMLFRRGGMLYLFEISKKEAFRICMGWVGGGG